MPRWSLSSRPTPAAGPLAPPSPRCGSDWPTPTTASSAWRPPTSNSRTGSPCSARSLLNSPTKPTATTSWRCRHTVTPGRVPPVLERVAPVPSPECHRHRIDRRPTPPGLSGAAASGYGTASPALTGPGSDPRKRPNRTTLLTTAQSRGGSSGRIPRSVARHRTLRVQVVHGALPKQPFAHTFEVSPSGDNMWITAHVGTRWGGAYRNRR